MELVDNRVDDEESRSNPEFSKLIDVISRTFHEDGIPKSTRLQLKQAELRLRDAKQSYLEQQLFIEELAKSLSSQSHRKTDSARSQDLSYYDIVAAELQHCLNIAPEVTLLGVQSDHLKSAGAGTAEKRVPKQAVLDSLEHRLKEKCFRVAHWHAPYQDTPSNSTLQLAKIGQLPHLLSQQKEEAERLDLELKEKKRVYRQMMVKKLKVLSEICVDLRHSLEHYKLVLSAKANQTSLDYLHIQCEAMIGKLDVMHHQLLKGICADGRLQALGEIRSNLLATQKQLTEDLSQTRHVLSSYESLGEEFATLNQQYREVKEEIENKQWALTELTKTST